MYGETTMNKPILATCFGLLILCGFMFAYTLSVTGKVFASYVLMAGYYSSLVYIMIQFIQKPNGGEKQ